MVNIVYSFERVANENRTPPLPILRLLDSAYGEAVRSSNRAGHGIKTKKGCHLTLRSTTHGSFPE